MPAYSVGEALLERIILGTEDAPVSVYLVGASYEFDASHSSLSSIDSYDDMPGVPLTGAARGTNSGVPYVVYDDVDFSSVSDQGNFKGVVFYSNTTPLFLKPTDTAWNNLPIIEWADAIDGGTLSITLGGARSYGWLRSTEGSEEVNVDSSGRVLLSDRGVIDLATQSELAMGSPEAWFPEGHFGLSVTSSPFVADAMSLWYHGHDSNLSVAIIEFETAPNIDIDFK